MHDMFKPAGLVAYWRPVDGVRHGLLPTEPPYPGQERETLCGTTVTILKPTELDWLAPTCGPCWDEARSRRDAAEAANKAGAQ